MANPHSGRINRVKVVRLVLILVGLFSICYMERRSRRHSTRVSISCPPCYCDCVSEAKLSMPADFFNVTFADCGKDDPETYKEMRKDMYALRDEEIILLKNVTDDSVQRTEMQIMASNKASLHYKEEAEKCTIGVQTCEEARERAEVSLIEERKLTALWILRAREHGWGDQMNGKL